MDLMALVAKLSLDSSEYEQGINKSKGFATGLGSTVQSAMKVGAAAIGAATVAAGAFIKSSIDAGSQFDSSMSQVAATMATTVDKIQNLREFAQEMGATTAFSASQAADALNYMALAGYDAETSMAMLPNVLNLAAAGGIELASASDMVTDAQSALGLSIEQTSLMVDQMAKASSKSNTSVAQLGEAFLTIGATARNVAGGTSELSTVLGVLADNGIKGAEGGTHLRNAILSLQTPTKDGVAALQQLGMTYDDMYDSAGNMRALPEIFQDISRAMEGMNQQSKDAIISGIFNKTDLAAINALIGTSADRWSELQSSIDSAWYVADSLNEQLSKWGINLDSVKSNMESLGVSSESFDRILSQSGGNADLFADMLFEATNEGVAFDEVVQALGGSMDHLDAAFNATTGAAEQMAKTQLDNLNGDITIMQSALEGVQIALSDHLTPALRDMVKAGTKGLDSLKEAFQTGNFNNVIYVLTDQFTKLVKSLIDATPQFLEVGAKIFGSLVEGITSNADGFAELANTIFQYLVTGISENADGFIEMAGQLLLGLINGITEGLPVVTESAVQILNGLAEGITANLPTLISSGMEALMSFSGSLRQNVGLIVDAGLNLIRALADSLIKNLPVFIQTVPTIITNIAGIINDNAPKLLACGIELIGKLAAGVIQSVPVIVEEFPKIIQAIASVITAFNWMSLGEHIITFIKSGITALFTDIPNALKEIGTQGLEWVKAIDWKTLGSDVIDLIKIGVQSLKTAVPEALKAIGNDAMELFKSIDWLSLGSAIIDGVIAGITGGAKLVLDAIGGLASDVLNAGKKALGIASPSKIFKYYGKMIDEGLALGITDNMHYVDSAMDNLVNLEAPQLAGATIGGMGGYSLSIGDINIYGGDAQSNRELADMVLDELDRRVRSERAAYE